MGLGHHSFIGSPGVRMNSAACNTHYLISSQGVNQLMSEKTVLKSCRMNSMRMRTEVRRRVGGYSSSPLKKEIHKSNV